MTDLDLTNIQADEMTFSASVENGQVLLKLEGTADQDHRALDSLLGKIHDEAVERAAQRVRVDVRELEFMSSSCVKALVVWIERIQSLEREQQYKIVFASNHAQSWQRRSLSALTCFAADLISEEPLAG